MHSHRPDIHSRRRLIALTCSIAVLAVGAIPGCVSPAAKDRVSAAQRDALARLRNAYAEDLAAFRAALNALALIEIETRLTRIELAIASRYLTGAGDADHAALDAAMQAPITGAATDALVAAARAGEMTPEEARAWLSDYALAWRMTDSRDARRRLVDRLRPARDLQAAREALLAAFDARADSVAALITSIDADADALERARSLEREFAGPSRDSLARLWREQVLGRVADPDARRLLDRFLGAVVPELINTDSLNTDPLVRVTP